MLRKEGWSPTTTEKQGEHPQLLFVYARLLAVVSLPCVCVCVISQYPERQVRLTELPALLPLEQYKTVINHNWNHSAVSVWPEVKHEVTAAAPLPCPLCLMDPW